MLDHRLQPWPNIESTLSQRIEFAAMQCLDRYIIPDHCNMVPWGGGGGGGGGGRRVSAKSYTHLREFMCVCVSVWVCVVMTRNDSLQQNHTVIISYQISDPS